MTLTDDEFASIMASAKVISGDITWKWRAGGSPALYFRVAVESAVSSDLFVQGHYRPVRQGLTYALIYNHSRRIYGLDLGNEHRDPSGKIVGETHKHLWSEHRGDDKETYVPQDITAPASDPVAVWQQFCNEARIDHIGVMNPPPSIPEEEK